MEASLARSHPLIVGAALAIILLCLAGAAAITGLLPVAVSQRSDSTAPAAGAVPACAACGTVVARQQMNRSTAWRITVRMDDGSHRTLSQPELPAVAVGDAVRIADGRALALR
jgi:outer membrane lipoprotein SlyB